MEVGVWRDVRVVGVGDVVRVFFARVLVAVCFRSVLYPALVNSLWRAVICVHVRPT